MRANFWKVWVPSGTKPGRTPPGDVTLPLRLVVRESCGASRRLG